MFWVLKMLTVSRNVPHAVRRKRARLLCCSSVTVCRRAGPACLRRGPPQGWATRNGPVVSEDPFSSLFLIQEEKARLLKERLDQIFSVNERRCSRTPVYGRDLLGICSLAGMERVPWLEASDSRHGKGAGPASRYISPSNNQKDLILTLTQRQESLQDVINR